MTIFTDDPRWAGALLAQGAESPFVPLTSNSLAPSTHSPGLTPVLDALLDSSPRFVAPGEPEGWGHLVVRRSAPNSQYDALVALARVGVPIPDGFIALAGEGSGFHGTRGRPWVAQAGNVHLVAHLTPRQKVARFGTVFTAMAANSVVEALDGIPGLSGRARVKWVNDIVLDDAKVGGALAYSLTRGDEVTALVLGIGLNVEHTPQVERASGAPLVGSLGDFTAPSPPPTPGTVTNLLLRALARNYAELLMRGISPAMERYRTRSAVLNREVIVRDDREGSQGEILGRGRVIQVGDGLELYFDGQDRPVTRGRLEWME